MFYDFRQTHYALTPEGVLTKGKCCARLLTMDIGKAISDYQKANNLTDIDLGILWGVNQATIWRIKTGQRNIGNKVRKGCLRSTPNFYPILVAFSDGILPDRHQTLLNKRWGVLRLLARVFTLGKMGRLNAYLRKRKQNQRKP